ncbi:unnamed protein product [Ilex paraguariensis]|uniref:Eisosome protein SEG2 n=1 Tax=Ilex paraguariensis TaxID=185542 RepID=A0ABC8UJZ3_9AQUA
MGCFLGCFGGSNDRKRRKQRSKVIPRDQRHGSQRLFQTPVSSELGIAEKPTTLVSELRDNSEEQLLSLSTRKKVTFDTTVTTYENVSINESVDSLIESDKVREKEKEDNVAKASQSSSVAEDDSVTSSVGSYPQNHRYQNCRDSDDEAEYGDSDLDDDDEEGEEEEEEEREDYGDYDEDGDDRIEVKEVWSESIPTTSMESRTDSSSVRAIMEVVESPMALCGFSGQGVECIGSNRNARDRSVYVHPVLNPVENLTQWKAVKSKGAPLLKPQKENFTAEQEAPRISFSSEPTFKQSSLSFKSKRDQRDNLNQEMAVDASLSNWLVSPETTPAKKTSFTRLETITSEKSMSQGSNSIRSFEDRPILGALTVEEMKQFSASCSPRRSPSRSPDEMPIIGTVGTYWNEKAKDYSGSASSNKGIPSKTRKYRDVFVK